MLCFGMHRREIPGHGNNVPGFILEGTLAFLSFFFEGGDSWLKFVQGQDDTLSGCHCWCYYWMRSQCRDICPHSLLLCSA